MTIVAIGALRVKHMKPAVRIENVLAEMVTR